MSHLEQPIDMVADAKVLHLYVATITNENGRMTILKSKEPILHAMLSMYLSGVGLTFVLMGLVSVVPIFPQVWRLPSVWFTYLGGFAVLTLAANAQSLPDLFNSEMTVLDKEQGTIYWNGQYACQISDVCSVRLWTRLNNGATCYRVSLMLRDSRAFHLIETTPKDFEESLRYITRSTFQPTFWPFTDWKPYPSIPTGGDNGKNDQFAFAWIVARFLDVPIQ